MLLDRLLQVLQLTVAVVTTLAHFPNIDVRAMAIMDDIHYLAAIRYLGPIFTTFSNILSKCAGATINLSDSVQILSQRPASGNHS